MAARIKTCEVAAFGRNFNSPPAAGCLRHKLQPVSSSSCPLTDSETTLSEMRRRRDFCVAKCAAGAIFFVKWG